MDYVDCVVVGAGVVGLAVARELALIGRSVILLEAEGKIGSKTSARNSEVIHSGVYYPTASLKAKLCVEGREMIYKYCSLRGINHRRCGKLIVATSSAQLPDLYKIQNLAEKNGVQNVSILAGDQAKKMEPDLSCFAALHVPCTGIIDSHALMYSFLGDFEYAGGLLVLNTCVKKIRIKSNDIELEMADGESVFTNSLVNAAGLMASRLALNTEGLSRKYVPETYYAKGNYFSLRGRSPFNRLIYPVPESAGLGVHLTIDLSGRVKFGPDVEWVDSPENLNVNQSRDSDFYSEVRKYWPALKDGSLCPDFAGIRPKLCGPGDVSHDFLIQGEDVHGIKGLVNLFGIESPGLTSCMAIGHYVGRILK